MNKNINALLLLAALVSGPMAANAQVATCNFSGTVTGANPSGAVSVGTPITGILVFNFSNAVASQSSGVVGSSYYAAQAYGGPAYSRSPTAAMHSIPRTTLRSPISRMILSLAAPRLSRPMRLLRASRDPP